MAALQDPLNQFFIQLSGGMKHRTCLSARHGARPAALLAVCTLLGRAVRQLGCPYSICRPLRNREPVRTLPAWPVASPLPVPASCLTVTLHDPIGAPA